MRKAVIGIFSFVFLVSLVFAIQIVSADACNLKATLFNQDPYPAVPGEEVKVVFQLTGTGNPECGAITFEVLEKFPFSLNPGQSNTISVLGGQAKDFSSYLIAPYKIKVNKDANDGENTLSVRYASSQGSRAGTFTVRDFNITVEDLRTDFEVSIKDYVKGTQTLTFEILNTGEHDVEALTIEIPQQAGIDLKGSNREIVGSLDSNEDTTFTFEAIPKNGEINLNILYTDEINERRKLEKIVVYDSIYFTGRARDQGGTGTGTYVIILIVIVAAVWYFWRRNKKKKEKMKHKHE